MGGRFSHLKPAEEKENTSVGPGHLRVFRKCCSLWLLPLGALQIIAPKKRDLFLWVSQPTKETFYLFRPLAWEGTGDLCSLIYWTNRETKTYGDAKCVNYKKKKKKEL